MKSKLRPRAVILTLVALSLFGVATFSAGYSHGKASVFPLDVKGYSYGTWERQGNDPSQGYKITLNNRDGNGFEYIQFGSNGVLEEHRRQQRDLTTLMNFSGSKYGWDSSRVIIGLNTTKPTTLETAYVNGAEASRVTGHLVGYDPTKTDHGFYMGVSELKYRVTNGKVSHPRAASGDWVYDSVTKVASQAPSPFF